MNTTARVGVDLAKHVLQVHAVDSNGKVVTNRALARGKFVVWCTQLPVGCLVAVEVSSGAHFRSRKLLAMGLDARIIPAQLVAPYRRVHQSHPRAVGQVRCRASTDRNRPARPAYRGPSQG